ncbi:hypothetical protein AVEN_81080-1 [Araneus ventricosus]|uniref:Uncharacterized protein n=1 Tax=Araneus ventricosus TaxID=182803 RepID=A0A4Y2JRK8_ARAVE|nr:hypothetical protein AVEN_81080-1 [Araneus ventricosus]
MRSLRINKRVLASSESTITVWACPLSMIELVSFGRNRAVAGDGRYYSGLSTRAIAATLTRIHRTENAPDRYLPVWGPGACPSRGSDVLMLVRWGSLDSGVSYQVSFSLSDYDSKIVAPSRNSLRVISKWGVNLANEIKSIIPYTVQACSLKENPVRTCGIWVYVPTFRILVS